MNTKVKLLNALIGAGIITAATATLAARPWYKCITTDEVETSEIECLKCQNRTMKGNLCVLKQPLAETGDHNPYALSLCDAGSYGMGYMGNGHNEVLCYATMEEALSACPGRLERKDLRDGVGICYMIEIPESDCPGIKSREDEEPGPCKFELGCHSVNVDGTSDMLPGVMRCYKSSDQVKEICEALGANYYPPEDGIGASCSSY